MEHELSQNTQYFDSFVIELFRISIQNKNIPQQFQFTN